MTEICKICNKEFVNIKSHVITKHHLTPEKYEEYVENNIELLETEETETITKTLTEVLEEFEISEIDLYNILRKYKYGSNRKMSEFLVRSESDAYKEAEILASDDKKELKTNNVQISESLIKNFGYKCTEVKSKMMGHVLEKTWILKK